MQLGFVSAILPDLPLTDVLAFAADEGFACVELMCWPPGGATRRYAGVTHVDVTILTDDGAAGIREQARAHGVTISGLGYYPNPLDPDPAHRQYVIEHLKAVIRAAPRLGVDVVNTFIGPKGGVADAGLKDDRLVRGVMLKVVVAGNNKTAREVHIPERGKKGKDK